MFTFESDFIKKSGSAKLERNDEAWLLSPDVELVSQAGEPDKFVLNWGKRWTNSRPATKAASWKMYMRRNLIRNAETRFKFHKSKETTQPATCDTRSFL